MTRRDDQEVRYWLTPAGWDAANAAAGERPARPPFVVEVRRLAVRLVRRRLAHLVLFMILVGVVLPPVFAHDLFMRQGLS